MSIFYENGIISVFTFSAIFEILLLRKQIYISHIFLMAFSCKITGKIFIISIKQKD